MSIKGSCLCGAVQFEIDGRFDHFFLCHCQYCQKDTGSAHASNLFSSSAKLTWISGQDKVKTFQLPDTLHVKSFCSECGSALPSVQMNEGSLITPAGCLDDDIDIKPNAHIFTSSRANWDKDLQTVTEYKKLPE
jgi:hypothetical protein